MQLTVSVNVNVTATAIVTVTDNVIVPQKKIWFSRWHTGWCRTGCTRLRTRCSRGRSGCRQRPRPWQPLRPSGWSGRCRRRSPGVSGKALHRCSNPRSLERPASCRPRRWRSSSETGCRRRLGHRRQSGRCRRRFLRFVRGSLDWQCPCSCPAGSSWLAWQSCLKCRWPTKS